MTTTTTTVFDINDKYMWSDFIREFNEEIFPGKREMLDLLTLRIPRVLKRVNDSDRYVVKRNALNSLDIIHLKFENNFSISYMNNKRVISKWLSIIIKENPTIVDNINVKIDDYYEKMRLSRTMIDNVIKPLDVIAE